MSGLETYPTNAMMLHCLLCLGWPVSISEAKISVANVHVYARVIKVARKGVDQGFFHSHPIDHEYQHGNLLYHKFQNRFISRP